MTTIIAFVYFSKIKNIHTEPHRYIGRSQDELQLTDKAELANTTWGSWKYNIQINLVGNHLSGGQCDTGYFLIFWEPSFSCSNQFGRPDRTSATEVDLA